MAVAAYKDLCLDAADARRVGTFWAAALGQRVAVQKDGDAVVRGPHLAPLWINRVPEPKIVKNRVHVDVYAPSLTAITDLGAAVLAEHEVHSVLADPEGNEFCVFVEGDQGETPTRVFALCVDSDRPAELAAWWQSVLGGRIGPGPDGTPRYLHDAAGFGPIVMKFVPVDDERLVKNRCHWDVTTSDVSALVAAGATVVRAHEHWTVLADPHGNEFSAFVVDR